MVAQSELARRIFGGLSASYDSVLDRMTLYQDGTWKRKMVEKLPLGDGARMLDVGCGTCVLEERSNLRGSLAVGIDITSGMIRLAQQKGLASVTLLGLADAEHLPFKEASFDVVVSCYVPKYCDTSRLVKELGRVLKPGGQLAVYDFTRPQGLVSPLLNLYLYPAELDYRRTRPLAATWQNLETSVRSTDPPWDPPGRADGALIYVSLGSLGSADVPLMERLVDVLSRTPHRYVVSKGPQHDTYELAANMTGGEFLPQTSILPHVDLVITHGGNNTTTECMYFGKPMIVLPIFWDQHDNAQRVHETSFGLRLPTYSFEEKELTTAIDRLLTDMALRRRLDEASMRLQAHPGTKRAADLIEELVARTAM